MIDQNQDEKYKSYKIPDRQSSQASGKGQEPTRAQMTIAELRKAISLVNDSFYVIEYEPPASEKAGRSESISGPEGANRSEGAVRSENTRHSEGVAHLEGTGRFVAQPLKIAPPEKDEIRDLFYRMRDIARQARSGLIDYSRFFDRRVLQDSASIFYDQAMFMKDFTDDYPDQIPFSSYFPNYQMLGYEQLRTYFTWRTQVRKGIVKPTSLSYVFLYIYELLNNVGVDNPEEGLDKLVLLWTAFRDLDHSIDKYVIRWFKDYHVYYALPHTFPDFIEKHDLAGSYPKPADPEDLFSLYCALSKYDIRKSVFFSDETSKLITSCFEFVLERIRLDFSAAGIPFDDALFHPIKKLKPWKPFRDALFQPWLKQPDRRVILSDNELYVCWKNEWYFSSVLTTEKGRQFVGYLFKQMESVLRKVTKYKYQITANLNMVNQETLNRLTKSGLFIDKIIKAAVIDFYRETTKTVVTVDHSALARIRQEALATQAALIVADQAEHERQAAQASQTERLGLATSAIQAESQDPTPPASQQPSSEQNLFADPADAEPAPVSDILESLKDILDEHELQALAVILHGADIRQFADDHHVMLEVLADGINEKAMDYIGDNLLDEDLAIYADYINQVKGMVE